MKTCLIEIQAVAVERSREITMYISIYMYLCEWMCVCVNKRLGLESCYNGPLSSFRLGCKSSFKLFLHHNRRRPALLFTAASAAWAVHDRESESQRKQMREREKFSLRRLHLLITPIYIYPRLQQISDFTVCLCVFVFSKELSSSAAIDRSVVEQHQLSPGVSTIPMEPAYPGV